jgi:excisionase family DNA binding protein
MEGEPLTTAPTPTRTGPGRNFEEDPRKALYRVTEAITLLSLSRTVIYEQIRSNRLRTVKVGKSRRIPATAIADYKRLN